MASIYLLFFACLRPRFPDVEVNPGPVARPPASCRVLYSNINGLHGNLRELAVAASSSDIVFCAETRATSRRHAAEMRLPGFCCPVLLPCGARERVRGLALYIRDGFPAYRQSRYECACCEVFVVRVCGLRQNFYLFGCYRNPDLDDHIFDCLLVAMSRVQSDDPRSAFVFVGDFNAHHREWLGSHVTNQHGNSALEFSTLSATTQLVSEPTHRDGGVLDLAFTDTPDLVKVTVGSRVGNSDHCSLSLTVSCAVKVPEFNVVRTVLRRAATNWHLVLSDLRLLNWSQIYASAQPVLELEGAIRVIVEARVPKLKIRFRGKDEPWFDDVCLRAFDWKQTCYRRWCRVRTQQAYDEFILAQREANAVYAAAEMRFLEDARRRLDRARDARKWWSVLRESVFGKNSAIPPLVGPGGGLVVDPGEKAGLLSNHFDSKLSRAVLDLPPTCHPEPRLSAFAFRSREVFRLLCDLDAGGGVDPTGIFPLFFKNTAEFLAPKISKIFRSLVRRGSFPESWRHAHVVPVPKGPVTPLVCNYRPISITPVISKVFEKVICRRLSSFFNSADLILPRQYAYRTGFSTCDTLLDIFHTFQAALDVGSEARLVQIDFSGAFDKVNHTGLLYQLKSVGVGGRMLSILAQFLSGRTQSVVVDGVSSQPVSVVSGVPQGSVLGPLLYSFYTAELFSILENTLVGYADDSTLYAVVPSPRDRVAVSSSIGRDLSLIVDWCARWGMELNAAKTKSMIVSRSRTARPSFPSLVLGTVALSDVSEVDILGVRFDSKLTFESHIRAVAASAAQRLGIMRRANRIFGDRSLVVRCFWSFLLPVLEYCSPVWGSASVTHLRLLDRVVHGAAGLSEGGVVCDLHHRRSVASLCMFYKVIHNDAHPLYPVLPSTYVPARYTRRAVLLHAYALNPVRCRTVQFSRCFVPREVDSWNRLDDSVFQSAGLSAFKSAINRFLLLD